MRNQKGITIVAMIITIIVMVILAGVAIATAVLDGGVLQQSRNAQKQHEAGKELEKVKLIAAEAAMAGAGTITEENLIEALDSNIGEGKYSLDSSSGSYFELTILDSGRKYNIYPNGKVEGPIDDTLGVATVGIRVEKNSTMNGEKYSSTNPLIPAGFTAINVETAKWDAEEGPEVDNGLVIRDDSGNEFVWVPCDISDITRKNWTARVFTKITTSGDYDQASGTDYDGSEYYLQKAGFSSDLTGDGLINAYDFKIHLTDEFNQVFESVKEYNGFYVGRFETSSKNSLPVSKRSSSVSGSGEIIRPLESDWYDAYKLNKKYTSSSVSSYMMIGQLRDILVDFWRDNDVDYSQTFTLSTRFVDGCGTYAKDSGCNIYDIYRGQEWTTDMGTYGRYVVGANKRQRLA